MTKDEARECLKMLTAIDEAICLVKLMAIQGEEVDKTLIPNARELLVQVAMRCKNVGNNVTKPKLIDIMNKFDKVQFLLGEKDTAMDIWQELRIAGNYLAKAEVFLLWNEEAAKYVDDNMTTKRQPDVVFDPRKKVDMAELATA